MKIELIDKQNLEWNDLPKIGRFNGPSGYSSGWRDLRAHYLSEDRLAQGQTQTLATGPLHYSARLTQAGSPQASVRGRMS